MDDALRITEGALSPEALASLAGNASPEGVQLAAQLIDALAEVAPELLPSQAGGPYAAEVRRGAGAIDDLLAEYARATDDDHRLGVLQALCLIARGGAAFTRAQIDHLRAILAAPPSSAHATLAGMLLAFAGDRDFLSSELDALARGDRNRQRIAAQYLGLGRFLAAAPKLLSLLEPGNASVRAEVLWALGELQSDEAVPTLLRMLAEGVFVEQAAAALGKIGDPSSLPALLDVLKDGTGAQSRAAAQAISRLTAAGRPGLEPLEEDLRRALETTIERGADPVAAIYALAAYARLGGKLTDADVRRALGNGVDLGRVDSPSALFSRKT